VRRAWRAGKKEKGKTEKKEGKIKGKRTVKGKRRKNKEDEK